METNQKQTTSKVNKKRKIQSKYTSLTTVELIGTLESTKRYLSEELDSEQTTLNGSNLPLKFRVTPTVTES